MAEPTRIRWKPERVTLSAYLEAQAYVFAKRNLPPPDGLEEAWTKRGAFTVDGDTITGPGGETLSLAALKAEADANPRMKHLAEKNLKKLRAYRVELLASGALRYVMFGKGHADLVWGLGRVHEDEMSFEWSNGLPEDAVPSKAELDAALEAAEEFADAVEAREQGLDDSPMTHWRSGFGSKAAVMDFERADRTHDEQFKGYRRAKRAKA